jgi:hypothetical protein
LSTIAEKVGFYHVFGCVLIIGPKTKRITENLDILMSRQSFRDLRNQQKFLNSESALNFKISDTVLNNDNNNINDNNKHNHDNNNNKNNAKSDNNINNNNKELFVSITHNEKDALHVIKFSSNSVEECYEFLEELLRPLKEEFENLNAYSDRIVKIGQNTVGVDYITNDSNSSNNNSNRNAKYNPYHPIELLKKRKLDI